MLVLIGVVVLIVGFAFFYLASRLQFVFFEIVLRRDTTVGPIWRRYGPATWRWIGLQILFLLIAAICVAPVLIPAVIALVHGIKAAGPDATPNIAALFGSILGFIGAIFLIVIVFGIGVLLLHDFGLPSMALEGTPLNETVSRIFRLIRAEPLDLLLYVVMKVLLRVGAGIGIFLVVFFGFLILAIPFGIVGGILWATLRHAAPAIMWIGLVPVALLFAVIALAAIFMVSGILGTFFQAYNLYFLGGRYPLLGEILQPTPPPAYYPPLEPIPPPAPEGAS
jgi:hypothetical protein